MKFMDTAKERLEEVRDARRYKDRFHYNWSILSGATLTVSINFLTHLKHLNDLNIILLKIALPLVGFSLILPLIRNFISAHITGRCLRMIEEGEKQWLEKLAFIANSLSFLSILFYIAGLTLLFMVFISAIL